MLVVVAKVVTQLRTCHYLIGLFRDYLRIWKHLLYSVLATAGRPIPCPLL